MHCSTNCKNCSFSNTQLKLLNINIKRGIIRLQIKILEGDFVMAGFVVAFLVGAVCVGIGISNMKGNISSLHSYHRHRVTEEDRIPFGKMVGIGTIIIGASVMICSIMSMVTIYTEKQIFLFVGMAILFVGIIVGAVISFYAMIKYNKGIF